MPESSAPELPPPDFNLWLRWLLANAGAELIGLGGSAAVLVAFNSLSQNAQAIVDVLLMALVAVVLGAFFEGAIVGLVQWYVLRSALPYLERSTWVSMTAAGAGIAWLFGIIPSTLVAVSQLLAPPAAATPPPAEPGQSTIFLAAALMGLVLGAALGYPQYLALARHVHGAGWWIPINAAAWAPAMVIVFAGIDLLPAGGISLASIAIIAGTTLLAGAVAGAIHGAALVQLVRHRRSFYQRRA